MLKDLFLLDPEIAFLNHGSFGACPRPVFEVYQDWQRLLERQPVRFLGVDLPALLCQVRQALGEYLSAQPDDLALVPNATYGVNVIARSLRLEPGDEVLTSNHEYGACDKTWTFICEQRGAVYRRQEIPLPVSDPQQIIDQLWQGVNPRTRLIFFSHYTSPTGLIFPADEICRRARQAGIPTLVDGAHAPGQVPVDLEAIGADFYTGNCHKWMLAPKGSAFLHARPSAQDLVEPLVVSWGWQAAQDFTTGSRFIDILQWWGTRDPAPHLAIPAAIQFLQTPAWQSARQTCHDWLVSALEQARALTGLPDIYAGNPALYRQMACLPIPPKVHLPDLKKQLYNSYQVEIPSIAWGEHQFLRLSLQGYNTLQDIERLLDALRDLI